MDLANVQVSSQEELFEVVRQAAHKDNRVVAGTSNISPSASAVVSAISLSASAVVSTISLSASAVVSFASPSASAVAFHASHASVSSPFGSSPHSAPPRVEDCRSGGRVGEPILGASKTTPKVQIWTVYVRNKLAIEHRVSIAAQCDSEVLELMTTEHGSPIETEGEAGAKAMQCHLLEIGHTATARPTPTQRASPLAQRDVSDDELIVATGSGKCAGSTNSVEVVG